MTIPFWTLRLAGHTRLKGANPGLKEQSCKLSSFQRKRTCVLFYIIRQSHPKVKCLLKKIKRLFFLKTSGMRKRNCEAIR